MIKSMARSLPGLSVAAIAFAAGLGLRIELVDPTFQERTPKALPAHTLASPGKAPLRLAALEHRLGAAEVFWLAMVQELGINPKNQNFEKLERWSNITTDLDEKYVTAYYAPAVQFTTAERNFDRSERVMEKGMRELPKEWKFPFLRGYNAYFGYGKPIQAADFWMASSKLEKSPKYLVSLAIRARFQAGNERAAEQMLVDMLPHLSEKHRADAEVRLKVIRSEYLMRKYDAACKKWRAEHDDAMPTPEELFEAKLVDKPPVDKFGDPLKFDEKACIARSKFIPVREEEAKKRLGSEALE